MTTFFFVVKCHVSKSSVYLVSCDREDTCNVVWEGMRKWMEHSVAS